MPLFGKKDDKKDGENPSQHETDAHYGPDLDRVLRAIPSDETPPLAGAGASGTPVESSGPGAGGGSDDDPLGDDSAGSEGDGSAGAEDDDPLGDDSAGSEGDGSATAKDNDPLGDDLMDLFTSEEAVDDDLGALTKDLEEVDMADLVVLVREVSASLKERFPRT